MLVRVVLDYPIDFLYEEYAMYRQHCREMIREMAEILGSKMAIYYMEYSDLAALKLNEFGPIDVTDVYTESLRQFVTNENEYTTPKVEDFYLRAKEIVEPCDWETYYDSEKDDSLDDLWKTAYFVDFFE